MVLSVKRFRSRMATKLYICVRCGAKTAALLFWVSLYMIVMKMTVFKSTEDTSVKDWSIIPDNYSGWQGAVPLTKDDSETSNHDFITWPEVDNDTIIVLKNRSKTVQKVCLQRNLLSQKVNSKEFYVDHDHGLVWCNIFKAASSTWMYYMNILGGYKKKFLEETKKIPLILARKKFPRPKIKELTEAIQAPGVVSLLIVREPFVRLLSAYRDKLEINQQGKIKPYYRKLARTIITKYRKKEALDKAKNKVVGPTFREFVQYLIDEYHPGYTFDEHWAPYYTFCTPCAVNFTVIAKVETLTKDSMYVIQKLNLGPVLNIKAGERKRKHRGLMNTSRDGKNTTSLLMHYYGQLDEKMLDNLLKIYGIDFEMFGYDASVYRSYVKK
ncbi:unnamed protein product [Spodoptera littoralis]|uniref:Carbohydrate sulfotransferase n=1 Tax=Spodoptera littoralis TaxID=7109 RepID=A0A9P0N499_SPOLI|nr:unnamed protein product [Spodoptera littoralis]CAH1644222.1 unnamed protein product [Spodoptera littoralis]